MATSGTIGTTQLDAVSVIEHAARRCGVLATALTAENLTSSRENLFLILSEFVTKGLQLWTVQKTVYPLDAGVRYLPLSVGTVNLENVLLRTPVVSPADVISPGLATYSPITTIPLGGTAPLGPTPIGSVVIGGPVGTYTFVLEGSPDGVAWTNYGTASFTLNGATRVAFDATAVVTLGYWRVRETTLGTVVLTSVTFTTSASEIPMTPLNKDDYSYMPNKEYQSRQPLQYWYDKQTPQPRLWFWPLPLTSDRLCVVWAQNQIQDVGDLSNTLQVPQRWLNAVISALAPYVCLELPKELVPPDRYPQLMERAAAALEDAMDAEVDGSPVRLTPRIGAYTK